MVPFKIFFENENKHLADRLQLKSAVAREEAAKQCSEYTGGNLEIDYYMDLEELPDNVPEHITGDFSVALAPLKTFKNMPRIIDGSVWIANATVKSLEGAPDHIGGNFIFLGKFTADDYRKWQAKRKYKETATAGTDDEAGLGSILDVL